MSLPTTGLACVRQVQVAALQKGWHKKKCTSGMPIHHITDRSKEEDLFPLPGAIARSLIVFISISFCTHEPEKGNASLSMQSRHLCPLGMSVGHVVLRTHRCLITLTANCQWCGIRKEPEFPQAQLTIIWKTHCKNKVTKKLSKNLDRNQYCLIPTSK